MKKCATYTHTHTCNGILAKKQSLAISNNMDGLCSVKLEKYHMLSLICSLRKPNKTQLVDTGSRLVINGERWAERVKQVNTW